MRWGPHAYGLQYHMELTERTVQDWRVIPEYRASLDRALGSERAEGLAGEVAACLDGFRQNARQINDNLMALVDRSRK